MTIRTRLQECDDKFTECVIASTDGTVLESTKNNKFTEEELLKIFFTFTLPKKPAECIEMCGEPFIVIRHCKNLIIARRNYNGIVAFRCKTCFIVAFHNESIETGVCADAISKLGETLENDGF